MFLSLIITLSIIAVLGLAFYFVNKFLRGALIAKTRSFVAKTTQIIAKISKKWYFWPILFLLIYAVNLIIYSIFTYPLGEPEWLINEGGQSLSESASIGRQFVNGLNYTPITVFGITLTILGLIYFIYKLKRKELTYLHGIFFAFLLGIILRTVYVNVTDNIFTRQHDVWSSSGYGHYGITMHIYKTFSLPELAKGGIENSYQMYHPKFSHYSYAIIMHINSIFFNGSPDWALYQSVRIFSLTISIATLIVSYLIMKELSKDTRVHFIGTIFVSLSPIMIRLSAMSNNDPMLFLFVTISIYFLIRFIKNQNYKNIIGLALGISLAMASKLSGALIAVPTAIVFIIFFIKFLIQKQYKKVLLFVVFVLICFPIALYWPIYNMINYDQPLTFVFSNLNHKLAVPETASYFSRFLIFDLKEYFSTVFMQLWSNNDYPQTINLYSSMIKSSIFGEFRYDGLSMYISAVLLVVNFAFVLGIFFIGAYFVIKSISKRNYTLLTVIVGPIALYLIIVLLMGDNIFYKILGAVIILLCLFFVVRQFKNIKNNILNFKYEMLFGLITLIFLASYFTFQIQYPYTCTLDYRYVAIFSLTGGYFISLLFIKIKNKEIKTILSTLLGLYLGLSFSMYLVVGV